MLHLFAVPQKELECQSSSSKLRLVKSEQNFIWNVKLNVESTQNEHESTQNRVKLAQIE